MLALTGLPHPARDESGQSLAEFALVLVIFMLIVLGIVDLSRAVFAHNTIANAAREGARYAATHPLEQDEGEVEARARALVTGLDESMLTVEVSRPDERHVQVDVTYRFQPVTLLIARSVDDGSGLGLLLRSRSRMRRER